MSKVSVIGAGNVGATCANVLAFREIADEVVLLDIKEGVSEGKAMDMMQAAVTAGFASRIKGVTNNYEATANSDMVVITIPPSRNTSTAFPISVALGFSSYIFNRLITQV